MKIFRHGPCWVFRLWKGRRHTIELVYAPAGYEIEKHSHPNQNISLCFLFGKARFSRLSNISGLVEADVVWPKNMFKTFNIAWFHTHWFSVSNSPLLFINLERWFIEPTSAAEDFQHGNGRTI